MAPIYLYDLAGSYQANFSVATAKKEGYAGGVSKITEGLTGGANWDLVNKTWAKRWHDESVSEGMVWGGYHFLHNGNGAAQARYFLDEFNKITGRGVDGYLVQLDCEHDADWQTIQDFSNEFYRQTHDHPYLLYTGDWWWNVPGRRWAGASLTPYLWHSRYVSGTGYGSFLYQKVDPSYWTPNYGGWPKATMLQYSASGSLGGLNANVDVSAFLGGASDLVKLCGGNSAMALLKDSDPDTYAHFMATVWRVAALVNGSETIGGGSQDGMEVSSMKTLHAIEKAVTAPAPVTVVLDAAAEARIIDGVTGKILDALKQPHTYTVTEA